MALTVQSFTVTRNHVTSLSISTTRQQTTASPVFTRQSVLLEATSSGGKKKRRRRRKQPPAGGDSSPSPPAPAEKATPKQSPKPVAETVQVDIDDGDEAEEEIDLAAIKDVASFSFDGAIEGVTDDTAATLPPPPSGVVDSMDAPAPEAEDGAIPLPDIKDTLRRKEVEQQMARMEEEQEAKQKKIDRKDRDALLKVCG